jgi:F-type H+-transporting ATPase subunit b
VLINWFTVLAQIVNFLILIFLLKRFLYGPIIRAMQEREGRIAAAMEQARAAEREARHRARELEGERQTLLQTKDTWLADAKREVENWREGTLKEVRVEVEKLRQAWMDKLTQDRKAFMEKLKIQVAGQVMRIGEKVLQDLANGDLEQQVITVFLNRLEEERDRLSRDDYTGTLRVESGFDMNDRLMDEIRQRITGWFPQSREILFVVEENIGVGVQVKAGDQKVAWNLTDYLENLEREILSDLYSTRREMA